MGYKDEYEVKKQIKDQDGTRVYLVHHKTLGVDRIMKTVRIEAMQVADLDPSAEAKLIANLRHPGIPTLYDLYRDGEYMVWIEEWIKGLPLSDYLMRHSPSEDEIIRIMISLNSIISYLHSLCPPILYQDLKPEHIYIQGERVVLIDYGIAGSRASSEQRKSVSCSVSYASPEQILGYVDEKSDLYSLGKVARLMQRRSGDEISRKVRRIIAQALRENPSQRPESVKSWSEEWMKIQKEQERQLKRRKKRKKVGNLPKEIAVSGTEEGVGCTQIAVSLTVLMNHAGDRAWYVNPYDAVPERIMETEDIFCQKSGIIYHDCFYSISQWGRKKADDQPPEGTKIIDCGIHEEAGRNADLRIYVCGSNAWKMTKPEPLEPDIDLCIMNPANRQSGRLVVKECHVRTLGYPADLDALSVNRQKINFYKALRREIV